LTDASSKASASSLDGARSRIDSTRDVAPLRVAADAIVLDSDKLSADEVFEQILALVK